MKTYFVYIMSNRARVLYVGVTNNLERRVMEHKSGTGSAFTAEYQVVQLVYFEDFHDIRQAIQREKEIKGWLRRKKIALVETVNPEWRDLSRDWWRKDTLPDGSIS